MQSPMEENKDISRIRDRGGSAEIGTEEDGAILEMYNLNEKLITIKEHALYEFYMADHIDPNRTNAALPANIQKLIINEGPNSELVSSTFLTAKTLFRDGYFPGVDNKKAISLSIELMIELKNLKTEIHSYMDKEKEVSDAYEARRKKPISFALPAIGNAESRCTTIFQKADRVEQILIEIFMLFYTSAGLKIQSHFPDFFEVLKIKHGEEHPFTKFIGSTVDFMNIVRELRNSLDHRLRFVEVRDFELQLDGNVMSPTIELKKIRKTQMERTPLSTLLPIVLQNFLAITELTFAYVAGTDAKPMMPSLVKVIPEDNRRFKHLKYAFWTDFGNGGWYHQ
jgi:hypothetical protein